MRTKKNAFKLSAGKTSADKLTAGQNPEINMSKTVMEKVIQFIVLFVIIYASLKVFKYFFPPV